MKITVNAETLLAALKFNVAEKRSTTDMMTHVLIDAHGLLDCGHLRLTTYNHLEQLAVVVKSCNEECAAITVCAIDLQRALHGLQGDVSIELDKQQLLITQHMGQGTRSFRLKTLPADDFPSMTDDDLVDYPLDAATLHDGIARVKYACSKNDVRHYLNGVYVGGELIAASDGYRGAIVQLANKVPFDMILPVESLHSLLNALSQEGARIQVKKKGDLAGGVCVFTDELSYFTKLVDARFPDMSRLVPASVPQSKIEFNCRDAIPVIERALPLEVFMVDGKAQNISRLHMVINKKMLRIAGERVDDFVDCAASSDAEITLNGRYLQDVLSMGKDDDVNMQLFGKGMACTLKFSDAETHIIMPISR